jgi:hypothetical protein
VREIGEELARLRTAHTDEVAKISKQFQRLGFTGRCAIHIAGLQAYEREGRKGGRNPNGVADLSSQLQACFQLRRGSWR